MSKKVIAIVSLIIVFSLMLSPVAVATTTSSAYIASSGAYVTKSGSDISVYFLITGKNIMDKIGATHIYLYEKNGNTWSLVYTFESTDSAYSAAMLKSNSYLNSNHVTYTSGDSSKNYYAIVHFYAEKGGGSDTIIQDTPVA